MSGWRDRVMDYGQLMGDTWKTRSNSDVFSVDGDLMQREREDSGLRRVLEMNFRPLFQRFVYGGEKISCQELQRLLREPSYRDLLPQDKVHELADLADFNMGRDVTYTEFVRVVMGRQYMDDTSSFGSQHNLSGNPEKSPVLAMVCRNTETSERVNQHFSRYNCCPPPVFILAMTAAQIAIYFVLASDDTSQYLQPLEGLPQDNDLWYTPSRRREAWRFFTYCFVHDGYVDLAITVLLQLVVGLPLELMFSFWRVMVVYLCGVLAGSLGQSISDHYYGLAGGAGGCNAVMVAHLLALVQNWRVLNTDKSESRCRKFVCSVSLRIVLVALAVLTQTGLAVYRRWYISDPVVGIGAHVGGMVAGVLLSRSFLKDSSRQPWKGGNCLVDVFIMLAFTGGCVIFNIVYTGFPDEVY